MDYPGDAAFSRDNSKLFIAGETGGAGAFAVLDSATGELLSHFTKYTDWARSMAIDPHERYGATGHQDGAVILWDLDDGKSRRVIGTHYQRVTSLCFSPSGERLLSAAGSKIFAWDVETGNKLYELEMGTDPIYEMKIVEDGATLVLVTNTEIRWIPLQSTIEADPPLNPRMPIRILDGVWTRPVRIRVNPRAWADLRPLARSSPSPPRQEVSRVQALIRGPVRTNPILVWRDSLALVATDPRRLRGRDRGTGLHQASGEGFGSSRCPAGQREDQPIRCSRAARHDDRGMC